MQSVVTFGTLIALTIDRHCRHRRKQKPSVKKQQVGPVGTWYLVKSTNTFSSTAFSVPGAYRSWCNQWTNSHERTQGESATISPNAACCGNVVVVEREMLPRECRKSLIPFLVFRAWSCPRARQPLCLVLIAPPSTIGGGVGRQADPASILLPTVHM